MVICAGQLRHTLTGVPATTAELASRVSGSRHRPPVTRFPAIRSTQLET